MRARLLLLSVILAWGISWPVIKLGVTGYAPAWYACLRYAIAACCLFGFLAMRGGLKVPARVDWPLVLVSGGLQMGVYSILTVLALTALPPGRASVLAFSTPIWVVPLAAIWLRERTSGLAAIGVLLGCLGIAIIAAPSFKTDGQIQLRAYGLLLGAAASWAVALVYIRGHRFAGATLTLAPWQMSVAALLSLIAALAFEGPAPRIGLAPFLSLAYVGPIATAFAYWAVVEVGRQFQASSLSMALMAAPCLGIIVSIVVLHESVDFALVSGILLVVSGIRLTTWKMRRVVQTPQPENNPR